jgi:hypothetical protein
MSKVGTTAFAFLIVTSLITGCGGDERSDQTDALPQITLATSASVKERKTINITATATDDKAISSYNWQQVNGPEVKLSQTNTATVSITAPPVDADTFAEFRLTVTDSAGQSAQKNLTLNISNNKAPVVSVNNATSQEKSVVQLQASVTDSDGVITSYTWVQASGPVVQLTGSETATPSFTAPSVSEETTISFLLQVTDDDNESNSASGTVTVTQQFANFTISGSAISSAFANADVKVNAAGQELTAKTNAQGQFTVLLKIDDDASAPSFGQVNLQSPTVAGLEYAAFLRDFVADSPLSAKENIPVTERKAISISVNEASTALFALIKQANNGETPTEIADFVLLEKFLDADELIEATAVARIAAQGSIALPQATTLVQLLANNSSYSAYVAAAEQADPGIIERNVNAIIADPAVTPPITVNDVPSAYYLTEAAGERFLPYNATYYRFNPDGSGSTKGAAFNFRDDFNWRVFDGAIEITFTTANGSMQQIALDDALLQSIDATTIRFLKDNGISKVNARWRNSKALLKRLISGERTDTFRITTEKVYEISPLKVGNQTINLGEVSQNVNQNAVMKNGDALATLNFTNADVIGQTFNIKHRYIAKSSNTKPPLASVPFTPALTLQMDLLEFQNGGVGFGEISQMAFTWLIDVNGDLQINFASGERAEVVKLDEQFGLISNLTTNFDVNNTMFNRNMNWMVAVDQASLSSQSVINPINYYWQIMILNWHKACWEGNQLYLNCGETDRSYFFGWQLLANSKAFEHTLLDMNTRIPILNSWAYKRGGDTVEIIRSYCEGRICNVRVLWPIKIETLAGKRRMWVLELALLGYEAGAPLSWSIPFRINVFDELPLDTPNSPPTANFTTPRLILQPSLKQATISGGDLQ